MATTGALATRHHQARLSRHSGRHGMSLVVVGQTGPQAGKGLAVGQRQRSNQELHQIGEVVPHFVEQSHERRTTGVVVLDGQYERSLSLTDARQVGGITALGRLAPYETAGCEDSRGDKQPPSPS